MPQVDLNFYRLCSWQNSNLGEVERPLNFNEMERER